MNTLSTVRGLMAAWLLASVLAIKVPESGGCYVSRPLEICPPAVVSWAADDDHSHHRDPDIVNVPAPEFEQAPPAARPVPFFDFTPSPPPRMLYTINPAAVTAMMNQGAEIFPLPAQVPVVDDPMPVRPPSLLRSRPAPAAIAAMSHQRSDLRPGPLFGFE